MKSIYRGHESSHRRCYMAKLAKNTKSPGKSAACLFLLNWLLLLSFYPCPSHAAKAKAGARTAKESKKPIVPTTEAEAQAPCNTALETNSHFFSPDLPEFLRLLKLGSADILGLKFLENQGPAAQHFLKIFNGHKLQFQLQPQNTAVTGLLRGIQIVSLNGRRREDDTRHAVFTLDVDGNSQEIFEPQISGLQISLDEFFEETLRSATTHMHFSSREPEVVYRQWQLAMQQLQKVQAQQECVKQAKCALETAQRNLHNQIADSANPDHEADPELRRLWNHYAETLQWQSVVGLAREEQRVEQEKRALAAKQKEEKESIWKALFQNNELPFLRTNDGSPLGHGFISKEQSQSWLPEYSDESLLRSYYWRDFPFEKFRQGSIVTLVIQDDQAQAIRKDLQKLKALEILNPDNLPVVEEHAHHWVLRGQLVEFQPEQEDSGNNYTPNWDDKPEYWKVKVSGPDSAFVFEGGPNKVRAQNIFVKLTDAQKELIQAHNANFDERTTEKREQERHRAEQQRLQIRLREILGRS